MSCTEVKGDHKCSLHNNAHQYHTESITWSRHPGYRNRFKPHAPSPTGQLLRSKVRSSGHMEHLGIINEPGSCMYMNDEATDHKSVTREIRHPATGSRVTTSTAGRKVNDPQHNSNSVLSHVGCIIA